jgi:hypothetical protein
MADVDIDVTMLSGVRMQVLQIRRLARQLPDHEISQRLNSFADQIDRGARKFAEEVGSRKKSKKK